MVGSIVDVYGGKYWNSVEVKADMIGHYLGEFSLTYKPIKHGKVGVGATRSSKFTSLKWAEKHSFSGMLRAHWHLIGKLIYKLFPFYYLIPPYCMNIINQ